MIDPSFQRAMVQHCRSRNIPVIFDEVFSGIWRLGHLTAAQMLQVQPDIACYAKLLTGELFDIFEGVALAFACYAKLLTGGPFARPDDVALACAHENSMLCVKHT